MQNRLILTLIAAFAGSAVFDAAAVEPPAVLLSSQQQVPSPPWGAGDERGMSNAVGPGTWSRCAWHMTQPGAQVYELSQLRSNTMPKSPFSGPYVQRYRPSAGLAGTVQVFNGEQLDAGAEPAQQGTQFDALGHFAYLLKPWDGKPPLDASAALYYGGFTQKDVKPTPDSPLLRLGVEKAPPLITTAVLLDAKRYANGGRAMQAGELVTMAHLEAMLRAEKLERRGVLPGDIVLIRTGWGEQWRDPDTNPTYYTMAPGLAYDAARFLGERRVVAVGLDTPFVDPMPPGFLAGQAAPAPGTPPGLPLAVHHHLITQMGVHHMESVRLAEMADAGVWTSCTIVLPLREDGSAGSPIRPVAIGVPGQ